MDFINCCSLIWTNVDVIEIGVFHMYPGRSTVNPYPTAFPYGNGMVLHFYQQQESSTTKTVHKVIDKGLKAYVRGLLEKYPTFGREKETGLLGALDT